MLTITVPGIENYDEEKQQFFTTGDTNITLEHSLVSLSKWESFWKKPFLVAGEKTEEQILDYINMMIISENPPEDLFTRFTQQNLNDINEYINDTMTASWFNENNLTTNKSSETITAELIYYWMIQFNVPLAFESWHLNRLFTMIKICNIKQSKPKKMSRSEMAARNRQLNAQRREQLNSTG